MISRGFSGKMKGAGHGSALTLWIKGVFFMLKVLYLLNFAGKAGTERYVETLVKYLAADGLVQPFFAYNEGGLLVERLEAMGVPCSGRGRAARPCFFWACCCCLCTGPLWPFMSPPSLICSAGV